MTDWLTANEVRETTFGKPPWGKRGYNEDEVDDFITHVVARLEGRGGLTADDVHNVAFSKPSFGKRGYNEAEVDAFLETVEATIAGLDRRA
ncbi:DivIVA domain-containing protein [Mycolicibacterium stellerae]|uniref:DivIVA domain-containing protein n=1 Tax=Mycolicibacterium stellerae TaxID=2358193 RepID=UPI000F0B90D0|nr:DivIVA domain-containing protein [Mycolicibacterium stellerae]